MKLKRKYFQYAGILVLVLLIIIQFIHPEQNLSNDTTNDITKKFPVPDSVLQILHTSCYDCHSNKTNYPWYVNIQPVDWWMHDHITDGKDELNFSEFSSYRASRQYNKLKKIRKEIEERQMPLPSYLILHDEAKLSEIQKNLIINWSVALCDTMKSHYPPDSLERPKRPGS